MVMKLLLDGLRDCDDIIYFTDTAVKFAFAFADTPEIKFNCNESEVQYAAEKGMYNFVIQCAAVHRVRVRDNGNTSGCGFRFGQDGFYFSDGSVNEKILQGSGG